MDRMNKGRADELTNELASHHFPLWTDPELYEELSAALTGRDPEELAAAFGSVGALLQALEDHADETGDHAASLVFEEAKHRATFARQVCERHAPHDLGPCAVPNTYRET